MASLCSAVPATAQSGTGLYEPFPEAAVKERAERYVERLSGRTPGGGPAPTEEQLAVGVFASPAPGAPALVPAGGRGPGAAGARAGVADSGGLALPLQLLLAAVALLPIVVLMRRARENEI